MRLHALTSTGGKSTYWCSWTSKWPPQLWQEQLVAPPPTSEHLSFCHFIPVPPCFCWHESLRNLLIFASCWKDQFSIVQCCNSDNYLVTLQESKRDRCIRIPRSGKPYRHLSILLGQALICSRLLKQLKLCNIAVVVVVNKVGAC